ncbi:arylsulfatase [Mycobacterium persicum]|uniref:Arylsulfatase n=1 Tax=Mycobacterium persicum TaxID=1487726 RepID=A0A8E2ISZ0_9MYCO|nr:sulfatase-like hydrolase/transferase [Mycobacterium persicum]KZS83270.1 arylsulfatase [Mycobacterium persicum]ORB33960.1 arylsulfatase [Mycobacterium persicum]ORB96485.1 arylsulfatase [Mycobacterium persicum]ORC08647.1 arylsulfatase [Mycobacterium persicum]VAZ72563.1 Arylsulfatase [Mycobacterium persicum]
MSEDSALVIVAGYQDIDSARSDFENLTGRANAKTVPLQGAVLIGKDDEGNPVLLDTGNRLGRRGAKWGAGVGLAVGLFSPALLAAGLVGAATGAVAGTFAHHRIKSGLADKIGQALSAGSAVIIVVTPAPGRLPVEQTLAGSPMKSVAELSHSTLRSLGAALQEAMGKFNPDRTKLPIPQRSFGGTIGRTMAESVGDWTIVPGPSAPDNAPNVLIVLIDDAGFGGPDTFGGGIRTPALSRVAQNGLAYNRFHVTAVCSPTRSALLTGRNHHRVGFGSVCEFPGPFPGYSTVKPQSCAALPRILRDNGYVTAAFGKWHLTPDNVQGASGPFDNWPLGWGFDHFWGFPSGAAGQYDPIITQDNSVIGIPEGPAEEDGKPYFFPDDLTDKAVEWLHTVRAQNATKPWLLYYSTGATHAPHHVFKEWADKYRGQFDEGWDVYRQKTFERQKQLGIIPPDTELTERPDLFPAWESLSDTQKKLYARQMEVFAGFSENADWNVGRLLDAIEDLGEADNTLVFYIWGDNGASMEGTNTGSFNEMTFLNGLDLDADQQLALIEQYGGVEALGDEFTAPHFASGWAHANNTPFQWGKQMASHLGGTRDPMVVAWPARIRPDGQVRGQFTHCIDIAPTVLAAIGLPEPISVDGFEQEPMDGTSFLYTFDPSMGPEAEERHTVQYFENFGSRAIYRDGWWACARLDRAPWDLSPQTMQRFAPGNYDPDQDIWELYYLPDDFSQANNLAAEHPDKLAELRQLWWQEAERNRVLPLLGGLAVMFGELPPLPTTTRFAFQGDVQNIQRGMVPRIFGRSYAIEGRLHIPDTGAQGVIVANADFMGGFALWVDEQQRLHHTYSFLGVETYRQVSTEPLPAGDVTARLLFETEQPVVGSGGKVTLWADDRLIGEGRLPQTVSLSFTSYAGMDIGRDNGLVVDRDYEDKAPYAFTGTVKEVIFDLKPVHPEAEKALHEHASVQAVGQGAAG